VADDLPGDGIGPPVAVVASLPKSPRAAEPEIAGQLQAEHPRDLIPAILKSNPEHDGSLLALVFPGRFA